MAPGPVCYCIYNLRVRLLFLSKGEPTSKFCPTVIHDGYPMVILWLSHGYPVVIIWLCYGYPMVILWLSYGYPVVILRLPYGYPMVTQLVSMLRREGKASFPF